MALKAGRVGVAKDQVDEFGNITGGTPENVYTKSQCDNKFELKSHIGGLKFRDNDGTAQYQLPNGEWTNFSSGGSDHLGWYVPPELLVDTDCEFHANVSAHQGGYYIDTTNNMLYIDFVLTLSASVPNSSPIIHFPSSVLSGLLYSVVGITYSPDANAYWSNASSDTKIEKSSGNLYNPYSSYMTGTIRLFGAYALSQ